VEQAVPPPHARAAGLALSFRADLATAELFDRLAAGGHDALLLRGPAIADRLYAPGDRVYGDCDVLVPDEMRPELEAVLGELEFATYIPLGEHWRRQRDGAEIDVHDSIFGARAPNRTLWRALAAHRQTIEVAGTTVPALDLEATCIVIALHAAHHGAVVPHTLVDLERALAHFDEQVWRGAVALAAEIDATLAFRQGLSMTRAGVERLHELELSPSVSIRSTLRRRGLTLPYYLTEGLSPRERLSVIGQRLTATRTEIATVFDRRAARSRRVLFAIHVQRVVRLPVRIGRLGLASWRAHRELSASRRDP
jgi:hypothetical protein